MEIFEEFTNFKDPMILKRKRPTKQQRPSHDSSSSSGGGGNEFRSLVSSLTLTTTSSTGISTSCTEEDEDMANCLILLAQSGSGTIEENKVEKFTEMASITQYVYECKTCNRTFPSFQALGGHRASHKKPKSTTDVDHNKEETKLIITPPPSIQSYSKLDNKPKIHECSICGSEFSSGQALGGHMRRHRTAPNTTRTAYESSHVSEKPRNILALDLNLPAPPEDDHRDENFPFPSKQQRLVFSSPALVDCHY
ncbi:Zinc finger protein ZAT5 [Forsythia ovata]|uniref:Zinc finger protein ZAT5 n=1 Tax=Forsythia ovata TaxID=205694 RepID=A0ABD1VFS6_9LAMI